MLQYFLLRLLRTSANRDQLACCVNLPKSVRPILPLPPCSFCQSQSPNLWPSNLCFNLILFPQISLLLLPSQQQTLNPILPLCVSLSTLPLFPVPPLPTSTTQIPLLISTTSSTSSSFSFPIPKMFFGNPTFIERFWRTFTFNWCWSWSRPFLFLWLRSRNLGFRRFVESLKSYVNCSNSKENYD